MTLLDPRPRDRFASDKRQANSSLRAQVEFIAGNLHHLRKVDKSGKMETAAYDFAKMISRGTELSPAQRAYLENIYEKTMMGIGLPSVSRHHDKKRKGLRFG